MSSSHNSNRHSSSKSSSSGYNGHRNDSFYGKSSSNNPHARCNSCGKHGHIAKYCSKDRSNRSWDRGGSSRDASSSSSGYKSNRGGSGDRDRDRERNSSSSARGGNDRNSSRESSSSRGSQGDRSSLVNGYGSRLKPPPSMADNKKEKEIKKEKIEKHNLDIRRPLIKTSPKKPSSSSFSTTTATTTTTVTDNKVKNAKPETVTESTPEKTSLPPEEPPPPKPKPKLTPPPPRPANSTSPKGGGGGGGSTGTKNTNEKTNKKFRVLSPKTTSSTSISKSSDSSEPKSTSRTNSRSASPATTTTKKSTLRSRSNSPALASTTTTTTTATTTTTSSSSSSTSPKTNTQKQLELIARVLSPTDALDPNSNPDSSLLPGSPTSTAALAAAATAAAAAIKSKPKSPVTATTATASSTWLNYDDSEDDENNLVMDVPPLESQSQDSQDSQIQRPKLDSPPRRKETTETSPAAATAKVFADESPASPEMVLKSDKKLKSDRIEQFLNKAKENAQSQRKSTRSTVAGGSGKSSRSSTPTAGIENILEGLLPGKSSPKFSSGAATQRLPSEEFAKEQALPISKTFSLKPVSSKEPPTRRGRKPSEPQKRKTSIQPTIDDTKKSKPTRQLEKQTKPPKSKDFQLNQQSPNNSQQQTTQNQQQSFAQQAPHDDDQPVQEDYNCWICHKGGELLCCDLCCRVFHVACLNIKSIPKGDWFCQECDKTANAESSRQSRVVQQYGDDREKLQECLLGITTRLRNDQSSSLFIEPVDIKLNPDYPKYVIYPMDLSTLEKKIKARKIKSPAALLSEAMWILHNCIVFNGPNVAITSLCKKFLKVCEIECHAADISPSDHRNCYLAYNKWLLTPKERRTYYNAGDVEKNPFRRPNTGWFTMVNEHDSFKLTRTMNSHPQFQSVPQCHPIVWAKMQGFPYWPAKLMNLKKANSNEDSQAWQGECRFFGEHDWGTVPIASLFNISEEPPTGRSAGKRKGLDEAMKEMKQYADNIKRKFGCFFWYPPKTLVEAETVFLIETITKGPKKLPRSISPDDSRSNTPDLKIRKRADSGKGKDLERGGNSIRKTLEKMQNAGIKPVDTENTDAVAASRKKLKEEKRRERLKKRMMQEEQNQQTTTQNNEKTKDNLFEADVVPVSKKSRDKQINNDGKMLERKPSKEDQEIRRRLKSNKNSQLGALNSQSSQESVQSSPIASSKQKYDKHHHNHHTANNQDGISNTTTNISSASRLSELNNHHAQTPSTFTQDQQPSTHSSIHTSSSSQQKQQQHDKENHKHHFQNNIQNQINHPATSSATTAQSQQSSTNSPQPSTSLKQRKRKRQSILLETANEPMETDDGVGGETAVFNLSKYQNMLMSTVRTCLRGMQEEYGNTMLAQLNGDSMSGSTGLGNNVNGNQIGGGVVSNEHGMQAAQALRMEIERMTWKHQAELLEMQYTHDLSLKEFKASMDVKSSKHIMEMKEKMEAEKARLIDEVKRKQWCSHCGKEAIFYCCWNTSYCSPECQREHWPTHSEYCTQIRQQQQMQQTQQQQQKMQRTSSNTIQQTTTTTAAGAAAAGVGSPATQGNIYNSQVPTPQNKSNPATPSVQLHS